MAQTRILEPNPNPTFVPLCRRKQLFLGTLTAAAVCGTLLRVPQNRPTADLDAAQAAVDNAQRVRSYHRRRTEKGSKQRAQDIAIAEERLKEAMKPLKSMIGRFPYGPQTEAAEQNRLEIRRVSAAVQRERRKLWKMKPKETV